MINRQNWLDVKDFISYQADVMQVSPITQRCLWTNLRRLIEWADDRAFPRASAKRPTFIAYLENGTTERGHPYSSAALNQITSMSREFLTWAREQYPARYRGMDANWVRGLRPSRARSEQSELRTRKYYTLADVRKLIALPAETCKQRRMRAAVAFLFLSGMRIWAFLTLPIKCVDVENRTVIQSPEFGVHTKNSKAAETYLLNIPDLIAIVEAWNAEVRAVGNKDTAYWYARLDPWGQIDGSPRNGHIVTRRGFTVDLHEMCASAGVPYMSPHKFRHGHAVYALKRAEKVAEMKLVSQNLMHEGVGTTDKIYSKMLNDDTKKFITGIG